MPSWFIQLHFPDHLPRKIAAVRPEQYHRMNWFRPDIMRITERYSSCYTNVFPEWNGVLQSSHDSWPGRVRVYPMSVYMLYKRIHRMKQGIAKFAWQLTGKGTRVSYIRMRVYHCVVATKRLSTCILLSFLRSEIGGPGAILSVTVRSCPRVPFFHDDIDVGLAFGNRATRVDIPWALWAHVPARYSRPSTF